MVELVERLFLLVVFCILTPCSQLWKYTGFWGFALKERSCESKVFIYLACCLIASAFPCFSPAYASAHISINLPTYPLIREYMCIHMYMT